MGKNIVITGEGIVSAIGNDKNAVLNSLRSNKTGIGEMMYLKSSHHELPVGEVKLSNEEMKAMLGYGASELISRTTMMGMLAVGQAIVEAKLVHQQGLRIVLINGTTVGGMDITEQYFDTFADSDEYLGCLRTHDCGSCTQMIAERFGLFDDSTTISTACSSAANALILGANLIKAGEADVVVAGGCEALTRFHLNGFNSLMILDDEPCKPFDENRAGLNLGEGAAFVVLESEELARQRNATIHAYLTGYGNACDAFHQTATSDNGQGAFLAMKDALEMAHLSPKEIDYVNAHGTGTPNNDQTESAALKRIFENRMPKVSSTKSFTGHTTSASGSIEVVICLLAMNNAFVPANIGWKNSMDNGIIPTMGVEECELKHVMCNSFGFGGNDSSIILSSKPSFDTTTTSHVDGEICELSRVEITNEEQLSDLRNYVKPLEIRRMGKIIKSSLLSSLKALEQAGIECPDAIITATSLGCLENSERLLVQLHEEGEVMLKPTYFMQSTHNTISSNIAIHTKCHGYNMTYTHGAQSLEWALRDARMLLRSGKVRSVLVGLHDETTVMWRSFMEHMERKDLLPIHSIAIVLTCGK
ncbi:MAG: beta-ketoacyl-[Prevotella sp.]|nr:beta-ketoacyl-[acyl-carrier-protein] synthase family protein [Prevotella sp.]